jgi:hypothetical protein
VIHGLVDLLRDFDAIKGDAVTSPAVDVDDDSSLSDSWDPQIRLILLIMETSLSGSNCPPLRGNRL